MIIEIAFLMVSILLSCISGIATWNSQSQDTKERDQVPVYKVQTDLAEIRAVVTDRKGHFIEGLNREDFELLEDDKLQEISHFSISRIGNNQPGSFHVAEPDKATGQKNVREQLNDSPQRTTILFVDNLHITFSNLNWVKQSLYRFINEKITVQDRIALVTSSGDLGIAQQFTRDPKILRYAIEQIKLGPIMRESAFSPYIAARIARGDKAALEEGKAIIEAEDSISSRSTINPQFKFRLEGLVRSRAGQVLSEASYLRESTILSLHALIDQMKGLPGQRTIIIISEGFTQQGRDGWPRYEEVQSAVNRAVRSGVAIYTIDAKGLQGPNSASGVSTSYLKEIQDQKTNPNEEFLRKALGIPEYVGKVEGIDPVSSMAAAEQEQLDGLSALAKDTGGKMYMNSNNISGALAQALDSNKLYYVLAYYLMTQSEDKEFRKIQVRIRNHPEYTVRTAKGFSSIEMLKTKDEDAERTPQQRLIKAIKLPLPATNLTVSAHMDFFAAESDNQQVSLSVYIGGDKLQFQQKDRDYAFSAEVLCMIHDSTGKQADAFSASFQGSLTQEQLAQAHTKGLLFHKRLSFKPGIYQARVGVRDTATDWIGTASAWVEVPDLVNSTFELSSLLLPDSPLMNNAASKESYDSNVSRLGGMIQGIRIYPSNDRCRYLARIYRHSRALTGSGVLVKVELLKGGKPVKQSKWMRHSVDKNGMDDNGSFNITGEEDLSGLDTGLYEINLSVKDEQSKKIVRRTASFCIE